MDLIKAFSLHEVIKQTYIEEAFSTYVYEGNGGTQDIVNGIDLSNEGGMVWLKDRSQTSTHHIFDTLRGATKTLYPHLTSAENPDPNLLTAFNSNGFSIAAGNTVNENTFDFVSWTFRKAPKFFDVVTYEGDGQAGSRLIGHTLGTDVGAVFLKKINGAGNWWVWHRGVGDNDYLVLNSTDAKTPFAGFLTTTSTTVDVGEFNTLGDQYVAYLFAHDPTETGLIQCGSYTGNGSADGPEITLGWEPQYLLIKSTSRTGNWVIHDNMRGFTADVGDAQLYPNLSTAETRNTYISPRSIGFKIDTTTAALNDAADTYIYMAIRRGPMKPPESGTDVLAVNNADGVSTDPGVVSGFPVDMAFRKVRNTTTSWGVSSRLTQGEYLATNNTNAEVAGDYNAFDYMDGYLSTNPSTESFSWMFRRYPGVFDVACYEGDGIAGLQINHNLEASPDMIWVKNRDIGGNWIVYSGSIGNSGYLVLNSASPTFSVIPMFNSTSPTNTVFTVGSDNDVNGSGRKYIAYLFATLEGISKIGSYTGNGTNQTIDCGFSTGARFILIKRTDSTGDWFLWDSERGIVAGNDSHLSLNTTASEVTTDDSIDPDTSGFIVNQVVATNINVNTAEYIFLAIA